MPGKCQVDARWILGAQVRLEGTAAERKQQLLCGLNMRGSERWAPISVKQCTHTVALGFGRMLEIPPPDNMHVCWKVPLLRIRP
jgi:hypothetical protein